MQCLPLIQPALVLLPILVELLPEILICFRFRYEACGYFPHLQDLVRDPTCILVGIADCINSSVVVFDVREHCLGPQQFMMCKSNVRLNVLLAAPLSHGHLSIGRLLLIDGCAQQAPIPVQSSSLEQLLSLFQVQLAEDGAAGGLVDRALTWELCCIHLQHGSAFLRVWNP